MTQEGLLTAISIEEWLITPCDGDGDRPSIH